MGEVRNVVRVARNAKITRRKNTTKGKERDGSVSVSMSVSMSNMSVSEWKREYVSVSRRNKNLKSRS